MTEIMLDPKAVRRFPRYPEYKSLKLDWLNEVPLHWPVKRLKWTVTGCQNGLWGDEPTGDDTDIGCVRVADFDRERFVVDDSVELTLRSIPVSKMEGRALRRGDLLIEKSGGGDLQPVGTVVLYDTDRKAVCSNFIARMSVADGCSASFLRYLHAGLYAARVNTRSINQSTGIQNLDSDKYLSEKVCLPTLDEQRTIAAFLDKETTRIDALIKRKERLIALLDEKRQAVITHAVTRGLNPEAEVKDSGINWVDKIPSHWNTVRIANLANKITNGFVGPTRDILVPEGVRYLQSLHIKDGYVLFDRGPYYVTEEWSYAHSKSVLRRGDVLIVQTGAEVGQTAVIKRDFEGANCHALIIVSPKPGIYDGEFLGRVFRSYYGQHALSVIQTGALHPHLNCTHVREIVVPQPPIGEQNAIVDFVDEQEKKFASMIATIDGGTKRLHEYRTALISAAVTGQIDVREEVTLHD